ncbi:hypothetical protein ACWEKT_29375 [Nocardia takedensis]
MAREHHQQRARELAEQADKELRALLAKTADIPDGGWANYAGTGRQAAEQVGWERIRALQTQAQIYATLAVNEAGDPSV